MDFDHKRDEGVDETDRQSKKLDHATTGVEDAPVAAASEDQAALLHRLQSQFGDLDLSSLQQGSSHSPNFNHDKAGVVESDDESSLAEPTPEELQAWQEAQFQKGQAARNAKKKQDLTPGQLAAQALKDRRRERHHNNNHINHVNMGDKENGKDDWEELHAPPDLAGQDSLFFGSTGNDPVVVGPSPLLLRLAACDPEIMAGKWRRLYSSATDGLSFPRLWKALQGYDGPTVLIMGTVPSARYVLQHDDASHTTTARQNTSSMGTLGVFTVSPWHASDHFYGTEDCFLFQMDTVQETVSALKPTCAPENGHFMFCQPRASALANNRSTTAIHGLGIGGTLSQPRLHITESLEQCRALPSDETFAEGDLLVDGTSSLYYFDVDAMEVWGVGGEGWIEEALQAQSAHQEHVEATRQRVRTVDKAQFVDDFRSGLFHTKTLFGHVEQVAGRVDDCTL